jgi:hypothetical protein
MSVTYGGDKITFDDGSSIASGYTLFRNRIINGAMEIDRRNAGASVTPTSNGTYTLDRWQMGLSNASKYSVQQSSTAPVGFSNSLLVTSLATTALSAADFYSVLQYLEGFNTSDLGFGTANAKTVTVSFWVRSSLTGTFGGFLQNSANNRSYPFSYTISSANTFEYKTVTIAGDTSGTWVGATNGIGLTVGFSLGMGTDRRSTANSWQTGNYRSVTGETSVVGTSGATFYITGVQLEVGSFATTFERRPYGLELELCQRYYFKLTPKNTGYFSSGYNNSTTVHRGIVNFPVSMRTEPTALEQTGTAADYGVQHGGSTVTNLNAVPSSFVASLTSSRISVSVASGLTQGQGSMMIANNDSAYLAWSAEL